MSNTKERVRALIKRLNISERAFERSIGASNGTICNVKSIPLERIEKICEVYPSVNKMYLLTGEGSMFKTETPYLNIHGDGNNTNTGSGNQTINNPDVMKELADLRARVRELEIENARLQGMIDVLKGK